jgi:hypothetical protein
VFQLGSKFVESNDVFAFKMKYTLLRMNIVKSVVLVTWILAMLGMRNLKIIIIQAIKIACVLEKNRIFHIFIGRWKYRSFVPCWEISGFKLPQQFIFLPSFMLSISG